MLLCQHRELSEMLGVMESGSFTVFEERTMNTVICFRVTHVDILITLFGTEHSKFQSLGVLNYVLATTVGTSAISNGCPSQNYFGLVNVRRSYPICSQCQHLQDFIVLQKPNIYYTCGCCPCRATLHTPGSWNASKTPSYPLLFVSMLPYLYYVSLFRLLLGGDLFTK